MVMKYIISAGVGAADIALEEVDAKAGRTEPFRRFTDWYRLGMFALGLFGDALGLPSDVTDAILLSDIPLLEKTAWTTIRKYVVKSYSNTQKVVLEEVRVTRAPARPATVSAKSTVFSI